jgi:epoxyqueuosine reductase
MNTTELVLEIALELGFDLAGIAPLEPPARAPEFATWLAEGRHGSMGYLERQRERIEDPRRLLPGGRSLLVVALGHARPGVEFEGGGRVARYAAGRDYHNLIGRRLEKLRKRLQAEGLAGPYRRVVDAGPLLERSHAARAGLGIESKAANLLAPGFGPWFFLGELILSEELEPAAESPTKARGMPDCGTCTACLDVCPTEAIIAPGEVDARRCISYLTIEHRNLAPRELRESVGAWAFGCDLCSEVCPWGWEAPDATDLFGLHRELESDSTPEDRGPHPQLRRWLLEREGFSERFNGSPLQRPRREGLARNAALVLGNLPSDEGQQALRLALAQDPDGGVRAAAGWALARGHGDEGAVRVELARAAAREQQEDVRSDLEGSLEQLG